MASRQPLAALGSLFRASLLALCCAILWSGTAVAGPRVVSPEYVCPYCKPQPLRCSPDMSGIDCFSCGQVSTAALACNPALKSECPASVEHRKDKNGQCCFTTYYQTHEFFLVQSNLVKLETSFTVILPPTVCVL